MFEVTIRCARRSRGVRVFGAIFTFTTWHVVDVLTNGAEQRDPGVKRGVLPRHRRGDVGQGAAIALFLFRCCWPRRSRATGGAAGWSWIERDCDRAAAAIGALGADGLAAGKYARRHVAGRIGVYVAAILAALFCAGAVPVEPDHLVQAEPRPVQPEQQPVPVQPAGRRPTTCSTCSRTRRS
jgi:hypothetical protein